MSNLHTIDLTNAWDAPATADGPWIRRFGRPTGLAPADRVWLVCESPAGDGGGAVRPGGFRLNGASLSALAGTGQRRVDITSLLEPRNELALVDAVAGPAHGRRRLPEDLGSVWLEIEAAG